MQDYHRRGRYRGPPPRGPLEDALLLGLLIAPALAASEVSRCTVTVRAPEGAPIALTAWGSTEDQAKLQAHRVARLAAGLHWETTLVDAVTGTTREEQQPLIAALDQGDRFEPLGLPGYRLEAGACQRDRLPGDSPAWRATWGGGQAESHVRQSPAAALEAARRRSCLVPYHDALGATLDEIAESDAADRRTIRGMGLDLARRNALACLGRSDPRLIPAPEAGIALARDSRWLECTAKPWNGAVLPPGVAWGRDLSETAEAALTEHVVQARRAAAAQAARAWARAWAELRDTEVRAALDLTADLIPPSPEVAYSAVRCRALTGARALDWNPGRAPLAHGDACQPVEQVATEPVPVNSPEAAGARRLALCQRRTWHSLAVYREVRGELAPPMEPVMALGTWGDLAGCDALCEGTAFLRFQSQEDLGPWPGGPDRSTAEAADASLDNAVAARDLGALLQLVAPELRSGLMTTWRREGALFWRVVPELLRTNGHAPVVAWYEVEDGLWLLVPR